MLLAGVLAGLAAGALWGLSFLTPHVLNEIPGVYIGFGRFFFFALASAVLILPRAQKIRPKLTLSLLKDSLVLSIFGFSIYYFFLVYSIQILGVSLPSLVMGLIPVTVYFTGGGWKSERNLRASLVLIVLGILLIHWDVFSENHAQLRVPVLVAGAVLAFLGLGMWTYYAICNARILRANKYPGLTSFEWTCLMGLLSLPISALVVTALGDWGELKDLVFSELGLKFVLWSAALGVGASWIAIFLWNIASRRLSESLLGQMIVSETIFALIYGFLFDGRFPDIREVFAIAFLIIGVLWAIRSSGTGTSLHADAHGNAPHIDRNS